MRVTEPFRVSRASRAAGLSVFGDSLIVAAAQAQSCTLLFSEDLQDGMEFDALTVRNPFTLKAAEREATYAEPSTALSRHRPRGRPRK